ncbi:MAG: hypothetical protein R3A10_03295 [Caldilineaceae bacterium]
MTTPLLAIAAFTAALVILTFLSRDISLRIQEIFYYISRSQDMAVVGLFLVLMPGIFIHESAHWMMARLVGLRTGKFRVWPVRRGKMIGMGQVAVEQKDVWRDSLVGIAPLLVGSLIITLIGSQIFEATTLVGAVNRGDSAYAFAGLVRAFETPDAMLWAYALFVVGNAMMPSASDREPLKPVLLYISLAVAVYLVLGMPLAPLAQALDSLRPAMRDYLSALIFVILLDLIVIAVLRLFTLVLSRRS